MTLSMLDTTTGKWIELGVTVNGLEFTTDTDPEPLGPAWEWESTCRRVASIMLDREQSMRLLDWWAQLPLPSELQTWENEGGAL
jgi:hypothetical protein